MRNYLISLLAWLVMLPAMANETLRIVSPDYWCPFSCKVGEPQEGFTIDILRAIFEPAGFHVEYSNANYSRALMNVRDGLSDGIPSTIKGEAPDFIFPNLPISQNRFCVYSSKESHWTYGSPDDLKQQHVVLIQGYDYGANLSAWLESNPKLVHQLTGDDLALRMTRMVNMHRADALIEDESLIDNFLSQHPELALRKAGCDEKIYGYLGLSPGKPDARKISQLFDEGMTRLRASGKLAQIMRGYGLQDWSPETGN